MENKISLIIIILAIVVIVVIINSFNIMTKDSSNRDTEAYVCAIDVVENHLKSPTSAKFCGYNKATITNLGNDKYTIKGYVDAQNSFGTTIREYFTVTLTLTKEGYKDAYYFVN